jgi:hypothetical protein
MLRGSAKRQSRKLKILVSCSLPISFINILAACQLSVDKKYNFSYWDADRNDI